VIQACGEDIRGPPAHRALPERHRHDDVPDAAAGARARLFTATFELRRSLLDLVDRHRDTILAVHTHTQRAQPTTVAHYLLAVIEQLERDARGSRARTSTRTTIRSEPARSPARAFRSIGS